MTSEQESPAKRTAVRVGLIGIEALVSVVALYGGIGLIAGNALKMRDDWLDGTPFTSWVLPGVLLLIVVAVPMGVAAGVNGAEPAGPMPPDW